jgi:hypothetical protein
MTDVTAELIADLEYAKAQLEEFQEHMEKDLEAVGFILHKLDANITQIRDIEKDLATTHVVSDREYGRQKWEEIYKQIPNIGDSTKLDKKTTHSAIQAFARYFNIKVSQLDLKDGNFLIINRGPIEKKGKK